MEYITQTQEIYDRLRASNDDRNLQRFYDEKTDPYVNALFAAKPADIEHQTPQSAIAYVYLHQLASKGNLARSYAIVSVKQYMQSLGYSDGAIGDVHFQQYLIPF